jgi:hypothetical protein
VLDSGSAEWPERQVEGANHNPPAASSAAIARNKCFLFIVFSFDSFATAWCEDFRELACDLERRRRILARSARELE